MERNSDIVRNHLVAALVGLLMAGFVLLYALLAPDRALAQMGGMGVTAAGPAARGMGPWAFSPTSSTAPQ